MDSPIVAGNVNNQNPVVDAAETSKDQQPLPNSSNGDVLFTAVANLNNYLTMLYTALPLCTVLLCSQSTATRA